MGTKKFMKRKLLIPERNILRRIFGPTKDRDGTWRIKTSDELNNLVRNKNIINFMKAQKLSSFGHIHRITIDKMVET
jgi:hypothetical protein